MKLGKAPNLGAFLFLDDNVTMKWRMVYLLAILAAALPAYLIRFHAGPLPTTLLEVLIGVIVVYTAVRYTDEISKMRIPWTLGAPITLLLVAATVSALISPNAAAAWGVWKAFFIEPVLIFFVAVLALKTARDREIMIGGFVVGALIVALPAIIQQFTHWGIPPAFLPPKALRVTSFFGYPNAVGLYLAPLLPLFITMVHPPRWSWHNNKGRYVLRTTRPQRLSVAMAGAAYYVLVIVCSLVAIIFAKSFGALAGVCAAFFIMGFIVRKTRLITIGAVLVASLLITVTPLKKPFADEFLLQGFSGKIRTAMWQETVEMLVRSPIPGAGLAGYQEAVAPYHQLKWAEIYLYPHNIFLNFWSETGIVGLAAFMWIFVLLLMCAWRAFWKHRFEYEGFIGLGLLGALVVIFVHGLVDVPYFKNDLAVQFWLLAALVVSLTKNEATK